MLHVCSFIHINKREMSIFSSSLFIHSFSFLNSLLKLKLSTQPTNKTDVEAKYYVKGIWFELIDRLIPLHRVWTLHFNTVTVSVKRSQISANLYQMWERDITPDSSLLQSYETYFDIYIDYFSFLSSKLLPSCLSVWFPSKCVCI